MSRTSAIILFGVLVMLIPFSGIPVAIRSLLTIVSGIGILGIGLSLRAHEVEKKKVDIEQTIG